MVRLMLLIAGIAGCAVGVSAFTKLFRETLDSPCWMIAALGLIAFGAGAAAIRLAVRPRRW